MRGVSFDCAIRLAARLNRMMGDNRDSSQDSRVMSQVGFVPAVNLVSRAEVLWFSQNGTANWWQI